ncbi:uncharacterized protein FFUJ_04070 [Fusarium fujikuroi IMI 58289]|uniref:Uncharacterized protein n=1 Tax=Gibberella fujikuroi (strain CBS 195.34 / IMI 58289 / NRRL A-6831) TaxID=1279085 RepID=S0DTH9_GIBF5|nr:uncharacterized protein FFUJ_04070 [Fusarium fujikuroi IMI 58289]KLO93900.1 uncharacterized protein LW94_12079 [Fusarium fujikuroi]CCT64687.1 uncharacterized protein FFUJ_04070 [Fusarium fujikuroi IMI 58289]SCN89116.1 uncharacterized protein FFM5_04607 [Fusarium fujikuroi]SCO36757.1 uncharacterized protein FFMR_04251 [Fusarium fujikuroi]
MLSSRDTSMLGIDTTTIHGGDITNTGKEGMSRISTYVSRVFSSLLGQAVLKGISLVRVGLRLILPQYQRNSRYKKGNVDNAPLTSRALFPMPGTSHDLGLPRIQAESSGSGVEAELGLGPPT